MTKTWKIEGAFGGIIIDLPWQYRNFRERKHGSADAAMTTMTVGQMEKLPIRSFCGRDTLVGMWGVWPQADLLYHLIEVYGLSVITGCPWLKHVPSSAELRSGMGKWLLSSSEFFVLCRTGKPKRRVDAPKVRGVLIGEQTQFYAPIGKHSRKPIGLHDYFEQTVTGPYLELFATQEHAGWTCCGLETGWEIKENGIFRKKLW